MQLGKILLRLKYPLLLVLVALLWSTSGFCIKQINWNPLAIAGMRSGIGGVTVYFFCRREKIVWSPATFTGGIAYALVLLSFVTALKLTTSANAIVLQYTAPVYIAILGAVFLRERPRLYDWLTVIIAALGMLLFFGDQMSPGGFAGNMTAMFSGMMLAVYTIAMRMQKNGSPCATLLVAHALTFLCGLFFAFGSGPDAGGWLLLILLGIFQIGIPSVLYAVAIKHVTALEASVITMVEPLANPVWVYLALGERPGNWALAGGVVILLTIAARYLIPEIFSRFVVRT